MPTVIGKIPALEGGGDACPTHICRAACCRVSSFRPGVPGPCEYLREDYRCQLHVEGGLPCKPMGCVTYPQAQSDVTSMNQQLAAAGIVEVCVLQVIG